MIGFFVGVFSGAALMFLARFVWAYSRGYADGAHDTRQDTLLDLTAALDDPAYLRAGGAL